MLPVNFTRFSRRPRGDHGSGAFTARRPMDDEQRRVPRGLRITFLLNFIVGGLVGLQHLVAPRVWTDLAGIPVEDTGLWRLIGAAVLGYAAGAGLAWLREEWRRVRIVVVMQAVWSLLGAAVARFGMRRTWITREIPLNECWAELLARVSPSLPERYVDRFARLVDDLLEPSG